MEFGFLSRALGSLNIFSWSSGGLVLITFLLQYASNLGLRDLFGDTEIADAQKWISQWIDLAEKATNKPNVAVRLEASHLLSSSRNWHSPLPYSLFRGSLRDGFWLTSFAVDHYCRNANDIEYCWSSFSRFLKTLLLELDAMSSWLEVAD